MPDNQPTFTLDQICYVIKEHGWSHNSVDKLREAFIHYWTDVHVHRAFGRFVAERRAALGLKQRELADKVGLGWSPSFISIIERGESYPRHPDLFALAKGLECSATDLVRVTEEAMAMADQLLASEPEPEDASDEDDEPLEDDEPEGPPEIVT